MSTIAPLTLLSAVVVLDSSREGWSLLDGSIDAANTSRVYLHTVAFERPFLAPPVVHVGIVGLDVGNQDNVRIRVRAIDITANAFTLQAETWWNTKVWGVDVSWLAIGT